MQHLLYQPLLLNGNKYLQQKWDKASYEMHLRKVSESCFDFQEQSMSKIQRENNMLLEKISHIMRTTGRIDNRNDYENKRYGELLRITKDNQLILLRLTQCQPHYSIKDWHEDWLKTIKLMESIARYPRRVRQSSCGTETNTAASLTMAKGECEEEPDQQEEEVGL
uniref:CFAP97 domain containing 2 n=1 Tax=Oncorhynchus kisutch TaxID=8019 RepID=A0A8C7C6U7_ONCKI